MSKETIILLGITAYFIKGFIWLVIDCYWYKSTYNNPMETVISVALWPLVGTIKTFNFLKRKWTKS